MASVVIYAQSGNNRTTVKEVCVQHEGQPRKHYRITTSYSSGEASECKFLGDCQGHQPHELNSPLRDLSSALPLPILRDLGLASPVPAGEVWVKPVLGLKLKPGLEIQSAGCLVAHGNEPLYYRIPDGAYMYFRSAWDPNARQYVPNRGIGTFRISSAGGRWQAALEHIDYS